MPLVTHAYRKLTEHLVGRINWQLVLSNGPAGRRQAELRRRDEPVGWINTSNAILLDNAIPTAYREEAFRQLHDYQSAPAAQKQ